MNIQDVLHDPSGLWVFDNDGTLYRNTKEIRLAVEANMIGFIAEHYGVSHVEAKNIRDQILEKHQTSYTLVAMKEEGVDPDVFLRETYLAASPEACGITRDDALRIVLESIAAEKVVLTNNPAPFAEMILEALGVADLFTRVYGMMDIGYFSKPHPDAFAVLYGAVKDGRSLVYVDDQLANVEAAHSIGVRTILVRDDELVTHAPRYYAHSLREGVVYPNGFEEKLCSQKQLSILEIFTLGHVCVAYKVRDPHGKVSVLKVGVKTSSVQEIQMNVVGYNAMRRIGLSKYIPEEYESVAGDNGAYYLMEYCGEDFYTAVQKSADPASMYRRLASELSDMYSSSVQTTHESRGEYVNRVIVGRIIDTYNNYIASIIGVDDIVVDLLDRLPARMLVDQGNVFTFSNWDLTPEDVYLKETGLKYSDPHAEIVGVPMIDLGCFAGVARDAHKLPGSIVGYDVLKGVALDLAPTLEMSREYAEKYFYLGRVLQSFLSTRHRLQKQPEIAEEIFHQGVEYLRRVL